MYHSFANNPNSRCIDVFGLLQASLLWIGECDHITNESELQNGCSDQIQRLKFTRAYTLNFYSVKNLIIDEPFFYFT